LPCGSGGRETGPDDTGDGVGVGTGEFGEGNCDRLSVTGQSSDLGIVGLVGSGGAGSLGLKLHDHRALGRTLDRELQTAEAIAAGGLARECLVEVRSGLGLEAEDAVAR
jgi:hypothetical protein